MSVRLKFNWSREQSGRPVHWLKVMDASKRAAFRQRFGAVLEADGWRHAADCGGYVHHSGSDYGAVDAAKAAVHRCGLVYNGTGGHDRVDFRLPPPPSQVRQAAAAVAVDAANLAGHLYAQREAGHADFTFLSATGTPFKVHKSVLAARSEAFRRAFDNGGLNECCVDLKDGKMQLRNADDRAVSAFVKAIYTGEYELKYDKEDESVVALLQLADMYMFADIKAQVEEDLMQCADRANGCAMAALVNEYALDRLGRMIFAALPDKHG